jgi:hypothetical protein
MLVTPGMLVQVVLFAVGIWWCLQMLPRWRIDLKKFQKPDDPSDRAVSVILWSITGLVVLFCIGFALTIAGNIVRVYWH